MTGRVNIFLNKKRIAMMDDGTGHRFFSHAKTAFEDIGLTVGLREDTGLNRRKSVIDNAYAMFFHHDATHDRAVDVRQTAIGPFYRMEKSPVRANYRLVDMPFYPNDIPTQKADSFFKIWQKILCKQPVAPPQGAVLVALQGKILQRRSMQAMSPLDMIKATIAHEPQRPIWLKLHPKETYSNAERQALASLCDGRVRLFEGTLDEALQGCDYIVTQNSAVLLQGMFYRRPGIVFGDCEYHHAFRSIRRGMPIAQAFAQVMTPPDFAKFAYWYLQLNCINTSRDWAGAMIVDQCRSFGWDI